MAVAGTICRPAVNDCDLPEACTGSSKTCPGDANAPAGTACEDASACVSGGTCSGPVCIGGQPELTFTPDAVELTAAGSQVDVVVKHTGSGAPISVTGASIQPAGAFSIVAGPQLPLSLASGAQNHFSVRIAADAAPGDHAATLVLQATSCADQPVQLHAAIPGPDGGTGGSGADAGSGGSGADGGTGTSGTSISGGGSGGSGGCSSGAAPTWMLGLAALAALAARRRLHRM